MGPSDIAVEILLSKFEDVRWVDRGTLIFTQYYDSAYAVRQRAALLLLLSPYALAAPLPLPHPIRLASMPEFFLTGAKRGGAGFVGGNPRKDSKVAPMRAER